MRVVSRRNCRIRLFQIKAALRAAGPARRPGIRPAFGMPIPPGGRAAPRSTD
jgi:hypothetical protein